MKKIIFSILAILLFCVNVNAATLVWTPGPSGVTNEAVGFTLYFGAEDNKTEYNVTVPVDVTSVDIDVLGLAHGIEYFFVVRAYNDVGESGPSNEVSYTLPAYAPPEDNLPFGASLDIPETAVVVIE